ncbi:MAG: CCA tRNA nucleotidyltransferase [Thermoplasmatales archaeon]|nr:CCA tRNA nucleotidyltransferase [Thermoplasmatales archaeon]MCW6170107.1 CCA tRNA nucleotidyltransferase [Thermoplasmatales archaeon]
MINREEILRRWKPDEAEKKKLHDISNDLIAKIKKILLREKIDAEPLVVGSVAKHTNVKGGDIDIFIVFSRSYSEKDIGKLGLKIGHEVLVDGREKYAEHPYVSGTIDGVKIDLVPCLRIEKNSKIISSVDRTPLHTQYVLENLAKNQADEVLLLKAFMKSVGVYGSEIKVSGFSGYICELLVIHLGTFENVIQMFATSRGRILIPEDVENEKKFLSPVVIIDPIDVNRNASAAVSLENLSKMKIESRLFLQDQSMKFFSGPLPVKPSQYRDRGAFMRIFRLQRPDLVDDIIYSQANRFQQQLTDLLSSKGFYPVSSELSVSAEFIDVAIETKLVDLPGTRVHMGPPVDDERAKDYIARWSNNNALRGPYVLGDRLAVDVSVEPRTLEETVRLELPRLNIGKHLNPLKKKLIIIDPSKTKARYEVLGKFYSRKILI